MLTDTLHCTVAYQKLIIIRKIYTSIISIMATCVRQMVIITILLITSLFFLRYFLTDSTSEEILSGNFLPSTDNQQKLHVSLFLSRD